MIRSTNHPHILAIIRALDRAEESDRDFASGAVRCTGAMILSLGSDCERFCQPDCKRWQADAVRAVVMAWALNAPDDDLEAMAEVAATEIETLDRFDQEEREARAS